MPIRSGIGIGEAQVFNTSGLANQFARQVATDQANLQRQAIANQKRNDEWLKDLATTVASSKTLGNGLHPQDAEAIIGYQDQFRKAYAKAANARTDSERIAVKAEIDKGFQDANTYVNGAKMFRNNLDNIAKQIADHQYDYTDDQKKEFQKIYNSPYNQALTDGTAGINILTYKRTPDQSEILKSVDELDKVAKQLSVDSPKRRFGVPITGKNIKDSTQYMSEVDPQSVFNNSLLMVQGNNKLKSTLKSRYQLENPDATELPDDNKLAGMIVNDWVKSKGGVDKAYIIGGNIVTNPKVPKEKDIDSDKLTFRQQLVTGLINEDKDSLETLKANLPSNSKVEYKKDPRGYKYIKLFIPSESTLNGIEINEGISLKAGDPVQRLNSIINQYSGEKVSMSKVGIKGGKTAGEKFKVETNPPKMITVISDGAQGEIPADQLSAFMIKHPKAKVVK